jgi:hypothetical protein
MEESARIRADFTFCRVETGLAGWAFRIRTGESVRKLSDWISLTTSPEVGASRGAEPLRARAASSTVRCFFKQSRIVGRWSARAHPSKHPASRA